MTKSKGVTMDELLRAQNAAERFTVEQERCEALRILAHITAFNQKERSRILRRALKINDV